MTKHDISIRIDFPKNILDTLQREKQRYINEYGSQYKSEPHITLYLDSYTAEGYPKLLEQLRMLDTKAFVISLLPPTIRIENNRHRNLYIVDVSNKESILALHKKISVIADPYRSPYIREKTRERLERRGIHTDGLRTSLAGLGLDNDDDFDPHITLGEIDFEKPQADIELSRKNLLSIVGKEVIVSEISVHWYGKEDNDEKAHLIEEVVIPFNLE